MAKTFQNYSADADNNTTLDSSSGAAIPLGEGQMLPRHVNDAVRAVMADAAIDTRASGRPARTSETFTVKIVDDNSAVGSRPAVSGKKVELDGQVNPFIHFGGVTGAAVTYTFDTSDSSVTGALRFYTTATQATEYSTNVTVTGTAGTAGASTTIQVTESTPRILFYQIAGTSGLGGVAVSMASSEALANVTGAVTDAQTAQAAAEAAQTAAETAKTGAETAEADAQQYSLTAVAARDLAVSYRDTAQTYKNQAFNYTYKAGSTPTNNAEYFFEQATAAKNDAVAARDTAVIAKNSAIAANDNNVWLGGYAAGSFPTTVAGVAVVAGTALFDTTNNKVQVYTGSAWADILGAVASTSLQDTANIVYKDASLNELTGTLKVDGGIRVSSIDPDPAGSAQGNAGTLTIDGNLIVNGDTTTLNTSTLTVDDLNIVVADGATTAAAADGAGITIGSIANATLTYNQAGRFEFGLPLHIGGYAALTTNSAVSDWTNLNSALAGKQATLGATVDVTVGDLTLDGIAQSSTLTGQSGNTTWDVTAKQTAFVTASGATEITLSNHANVVAGTGLTLVITDASGASFTGFAAGPTVVYPGGTAPTLEGAANKYLVISLLAMGSSTFLANSVNIG